MFLAVDVGNSQTSFGVFDGSFDKARLLWHWRFQTRLLRTPDEFAAQLFPLMSFSKVNVTEIRGVALCSVVPTVDFAFEIFCNQYLKLSPLKITYDMKLAFELDVDVPSEVGADRLANAAYAVEHLTLPAVVIDMGTATTFDTVRQGGAFEGGLILPGLRMGLESLSGGTSKLPLVSLSFPKKLIGHNTVECIQSGVLFGYLEMINGLLERLDNETLCQWTVVLTGGYASLFENKLKRKATHLPNLTLEGIEILYRKNCQ